MKKPKISLDKDKLQAFFLNHVEKILLGVIVGLMLLLIWRGFSLPHLDGSMTPQGLISKGESTKQYVDSPERWINEVSKQTPRVVNFDVERQVKDIQKKTNALAYLLPNALNRPDFPKLSPREDPELFAPINLVVKAVVGPLASYLRPNELEYVDPLFPVSAVSNDPIERAKAKQKAIRDAKKAQQDLAGGYGPGGEDGGMPGGGRGKTKRGKRGSGDDAGSEYAGRGGPRGGTAMPGGSDGGYGGGYGGMLGANGMAGGLYPESAMFGYIPQNPEATIARDVASVTVMAVVPIQKQVEEFERKLAESLDYNPQRDTPWYLDFRIQRVDVTELDPAAPIAENMWQAMPQPKSMLIELMGDLQNPNSVGLYAGAPLDVLDPNYLDFEALTHPAPPYLQRDLWDLLTHPDVPLATVGLQYGETVAGAANATTPAAAGGSDDAPSLPAGMLPGSMPGGMPGGGSDGGYGGGMRGGYGGMRGGYGGMPGGSASEGMGGGMRGGYAAPRMGGYGGRGGDTDGGGGYGGGYGAGAINYTPPKYKLIRFTDTRVEHGRKYRYRIRLFAHDPNHPMLGIIAPSAASLHGDVQKRVKALDDADSKKPKDKTTGLPPRTSWVLTPWSEPSPIAELPPAARVFAVKVKPKAPVKIGRVDVAMNEPDAEALAVVFDPAKIADIPAENPRVSRGSVLNFTQEKLKVIHPVTKEVVELTSKYEVTTNALVADLMGGEAIKSINAGAAAQGLTTLGELLVVDSQGKLRVQNESDDIESFRRYTVPKEDPKAAQAGAAGIDGGVTMPGGEGGRALVRRGSDF